MRRVTPAVEVSTNGSGWCSHTDLLPTSHRFPANSRASVAGKPCADGRPPTNARPLHCAGRTALAAQPLRLPPATPRVMHRRCAPTTTITIPSRARPRHRGSARVGQPADRRSPCRSTGESRPNPTWLPPQPLLATGVHLPSAGGTTLAIGIIAFVTESAPSGILQNSLKHLRENLYLLCTSTKGYLQQWPEPPS